MLKRLAVCPQGHTTTFRITQRSSNLRREP